jgi:hypothetical protein
MAKIENDGEKKTTSEVGERRYEVVVSFHNLDKGEVFTSETDDWTKHAVEQGYLRVIEGDEPGREVPSERGEVRPR